MISFEEAGTILDEAVEALPEEIFRELNGGVNLLPDTRESGDGRYTLGLYHNDAMGRYVEIFYGSFRALYGDISREEWKQHLIATLHHELTHHIEGLAGDRTLERWDEAQTEAWLAGGAPLSAKSLLFVDGDGELARQADALFREAAQKRALEVRSGCCALGAATAALLEQYEAVLCMTLEEADALAARFPAADEKILCLGEKDILPGRHALRAIRREIAYLADELCMED